MELSEIMESDVRDLMRDSDRQFNIGSIEELKQYVEIGWCIIDIRDEDSDPNLEGVENYYNMPMINAPKQRRKMEFRKRFAEFFREAGPLSLVIVSNVANYIYETVEALLRLDGRIDMSLAVYYSGMGCYGPRTVPTRLSDLVDRDDLDELCVEAESSLFVERIRRDDFMGSGWYLVDIRSEKEYNWNGYDDSYNIPFDDSFYERFYDTFGGVDQANIILMSMGCKNLAKAIRELAKLHERDINIVLLNKVAYSRRKKVHEY